MIRFISLLLLVLPIVLFGQGKPLGEKGSADQLVKIKQFTIKDGLPTNVINSGIQGKRGFIWLGTREGLVRYDGKTFKTFTKQDGLVTNNVTSVVQVEDDWLWLICCSQAFDNNLGGSVVLFNTITHQVLPLEKRFEHAENVQFKQVKPLQDTALILYSNKSEFYAYSPHSGLRKLGINIVTNNNFLPSPTGVTWVSKEDPNHGGNFKVFSFNFKGQVEEEFEIVNISKSPFFLLGFNHDNRPIGTVYFAKNDRIELAQLTASGSIESVTSTIERVSKATNLFKVYGASVMLDGQRALLFRSMERGLFLQYEGREWQPLLDSITNRSLPNVDLRRSVFTSPNSSIWICTKEGLIKLTVTEDRFQKYLTTDDLNKANSIRGIVTDSKGSIYTSADVIGAVQIPLNGKAHRLATLRPIPMYKRGNSLYFNQEVTLYQFNFDTGSINSKPLLDIGDIWTIYVDRDSTWWFGGGSGMAYANEWNGSLNYVTESFYGTERTHSNTYQIFDSDGALWFVTSTGLFTFDRESGIAHRIENEWLRDVHQVHREGSVWWISTNGNGLIKWNRKQGLFQRFSTMDGLSSNTLYACQNDGFGHLWLSSNYGLMQLDTARMMVYTYTTKHGLPHHEFNRISWHKDADGHLYFGGLNGLIKFSPAEFVLEDKVYEAPLQISNFLQYNEKQQRLEDKTINLQSTGTVELKPESGFFTLEINLLDFQDDLKRYAYQFTNLQDDWTSLESNVLQIGDLPFGSHQLKIKGQNQRGQWSTNELNITVKVFKPIYLQLWFIISVVLVTFGVFLWVIRWRTKRLKRESDRLQVRVDEQTQELQRSVAEKDVLLREVHHRVKNNLQIISSLLNLERTAGHDEKTLQLIKEARHRIKSMALIHKNLYQQDDLSHILVKEYFNELMSGLNASYNNRKEEVSYGIQTHVLTLDADKAVPVGIVVTEIVTNAFKYAFQDREQGFIELILTEHGEHLHLTVRDDGGGLPESFRTLESKSLGLRLVKLLIGQLKGDYKVEVENGTSFIFEFPK